MAVNTTRFPLRGTQPRSATTRRVSAHPQGPSDDEILGLVTAVPRPSQAAAVDMDDDAAKSAGAPAAANPAQPAAAQPAGSDSTQSGAPNAQAQPATSNSVAPELAPILNAHPPLRDAWDAAQQFRAVFATPAAALDAKNQLDELDGMFFSAQPGDQAALAARIHDLSPGAFHALAQAMQAHAAKVAAGASQSPASANSVAAPQPNASASPSASSPAASAAAAPAAVAAPVAHAVVTASAPVTQGPAKPTAPAISSPQPAAQQIVPQAADPRRTAQLAFFHSANSAAVQQVIAAIEAQVNHLLPAGVSAPTKTRIVGEIYHDLGAALGANRQLGQQLRDAFRSGASDPANQQAHQQAIVSLVTGRAKQALPSIARRVIGEWTHSVVSANHEKLSRHDAAAKRVDIAGAGSSDGVNRKPISPRDVDYKRLSDADILNL
ncbi:MAG: hypothetical protein WA185_19255 [Candidatus Acidiferrales bacterium]